MEETEAAATVLLPVPDVRLFRSVTLRNILSFGPATPRLELRALNVLIGPNGSGKSNLLDALTLLRYAPKDLPEAVRQDGSSVGDWIWRGDRKAAASISVEITDPDPALGVMRHYLKFQETNYRFDLRVEWLDGARTEEEGLLQSPHFVREENKDGKIYSAEKLYHPIYYDREDPTQSVLALRRDPIMYPQVTQLAHLYESIRFYREWTFGRGAPQRQAQKPDTRNDFLLEDGSNLGLILSRLRRESDVKARILKSLNELYEGITDFDVAIEAGTVQVFLQEGKYSIPVSRLSDGTLRFLSLLVILLHPAPPPLICLEEPELGLHPDAVLAIGKLIKETSERTQLIVTTHSDILLDALGGNPEDVIVCEKHEGQTEMQRLSEAELRGWLERYSLSQLWTRGKLGGNRW
jgi:predicted ATPase